MRDALMLFAEPFVTASRRFAVHIPTVTAAFLFLLAGMFAARAVRTLFERFLERAKLDDYTARVGINEVLARLGFGKSPTYVIAFLAYWFILCIFIVSAANAVDMTVVSDLLERFVIFIPSLVAALLILFGGLLFGRFLSEVVANAAAANNIRGGSYLSRAAYVMTLLFSAAAAMEQLGMRMTLVTSALQIVLGSAGLATAIAFGFGGRKAAAELIRELFDRPRR
jgi:hypothetical protein